MKPAVVVLVTGHPATGKTTLARYLARELHLPLIYKDHIKETLADMLGTSTLDWSRKLGGASWALLYQQVETLLEAGVDHMVEGNFGPEYATARWQRLTSRYALRLIQVRCETDPDTLLARDRARMESGERHATHFDLHDDPAFLEAIRRGPMNWIAVESERVSVNTAELAVEDYPTVAQRIRKLL